MKLSNPHRNRHHIAPKTDLTVADAVDGAATPFHRCGRKRHGVVVTGGGVIGQHDKALAAAAIDLNFALIQEKDVALPAPAHMHVVAADLRGDDWLEGGQIRSGLLRAFDAEGFAEGDVVVGVGLDLFDQSAETQFDARGDGCHHEGKGRRHRHAAERRGAAIALKILPGSPLLGARLPLRHAQQGGVSRDVGFERDQLRRKGVVVGL
jgi:hypothetical protein